jgi:uroporphyrinogen-III synthase
MKILIIRPEPGASASADRARAAGFEPVKLPFFEVTPRALQVPDSARYDAMLVTSANAIRHAGPGLQLLSALPVHAVGQHSADAARDAGLQVASIGASGVEDALAQAASAGHNNLLWLAGEEHKVPDPVAGVTLDTLICYASDPVALPDDAASIISSADIVALHSPRAAKLFAQTIDQLGIARSNFILGSFSSAIAEAAGGGWRDIAVAATPTDSALLSAITKLVKLPPVAATDKDMK